jgi:hypothetical protein
MLSILDIIQLDNNFGFRKFWLLFYLTDSILREINKNSITAFGKNIDEYYKIAKSKNGES